MAGIKKYEDELMTLTTDDLRVLLHIGRDKAYKLMNRPDFPSMTIGHSKVVSRTAYLIWLERHEGDVVSL